MRRLVINADDFGFTRDVNAGIVQAHRHGILTAATLMANGAAFEDAVRLARDNPGLDIGCHLVLVQGPALARPGEALPATLSALLRALAWGRVKPFEELRAQIERVLAAGLRPSHLDTHKHTHLLPPVLDAVGRLSREFAIPWVRQPFDFETRGLKARLVRLRRGRFRAVLARYGCRTTDHFAGFALTGRLDTAELTGLIRSLPPGSTELMCHPGYATEELEAAPTRLRQSRAIELAALTAPETRRALLESGVGLAGFQDL